MKEEIWRPVEGFKGQYEVSSEGRVRSLPRDIIKCRGGLYHLPQRVLKSATNKKGYLYVNLCNSGKGKKYTVHRLVAQAFISNPENLHEVNHRDECKQNNCVDNLEWCDRSYNVNYGTGRARRAATKSKPVQQFSKDGVLVALWPSIKEAWRHTGVKQSNICSCCNGKLQSAGGYVWKYA